MVGMAAYSLSWTDVPLQMYDVCSLLLASLDALLCFVYHVLWLMLLPLLQPGP